MNFEGLYIAILFIALMLLLVMMFKNDVTCRQQKRIANAIYVYGLVCIRSGAERKVDFDDMEHYDRTLFRFWDWGYTRILPPDKFEIIKDYVK